MPHLERVQAIMNSARHFSILNLSFGIGPTKEFDNPNKKEGFLLLSKPSEVINLIRSHTHITYDV